MQAQISHRHGHWNEGADDYSLKRLRKLERSVLAHDIAPGPLHLSVREQGHRHTECSARWFLPGTVLTARASDHSLFMAMRSVFDELEQQFHRYWRRSARHL
jgi:ribosome-associated translation inhibitor RaiA